MIHEAPGNQGLYNSSHEHDSCGIGFVANIKGKPSHEIVERGIEVLERMEHRGAESADNKTGDGAGLLIQIPHDLLQGRNAFSTRKGPLWNRHCIPAARQR